MRDASRCQGYGHPVAGVDDLEGPFVPAHLRLARAGDADAQKYLAGVPLREVATLENVVGSVRQRGNVALELGDEHVDIVVRASQGSRAEALDDVPAPLRHVHDAPR